MDTLVCLDIPLSSAENFPELNLVAQGTANHLHDLWDQGILKGCTTAIHLWQVRGFLIKGCSCHKKKNDSFTLSSTFTEYELGPDWRLYKLNLTCIVFAVFNMFCLHDWRDFIVSSDGIIVSQWGRATTLHLRTALIQTTNCFMWWYQIHWIKLLISVWSASIGTYAHARSFTT